MLRRTAVLLAVAAAALPGCTKARAKTAPTPPPPLTTPAPPDRVIVPAPHPVAVAPPAQEPTAPPAVTRPPDTAPARRPTPPAAPPPVAAPPEQPAASSPPPILQTTPNPGEVEEQARTLIAAARRDLDQLNPARLSANARAQYDSARGFIHQAEDQLRVKNVALARDLAEKAAELANQLKR